MFHNTECKRNLSETVRVQFETRKDGNGSKPCLELWRQKKNVSLLLVSEDVKTTEEKVTAVGKIKDVTEVVTQL